MKCPHCDVTLAVSHRQDIEIDYCPQCRGVWLDRGELDKILARSKSYEDDDDDDRRRGGDRPRDDDRRDDGRRGDEHRQPYYPKRKSFWSELFD